MQQYKKIIEIMNKINSAMSLKTLLSLIIDSAKELINAEGASYLVLDEKSDELIFDIVISDKGEIIQGKRIKVGEGIAGLVAKNREPIIIDNVEQCDNFYEAIDSSTGFKTKNIIAVPVMIRDQLIGVLEVVNSYRPNGFIEDDIHMLQYLADAAAVAINKNDLLTNLKNRVDELTCIYEISQSIYFTFDIDEFLLRVLNAVNSVIRAKRCSFLILNEDNTSVEHFVSTTGNNKFSIDLENSLMAHVIKTGDPLLVYDVEQDMKMIPSMNRDKKYRSNSFITVPMKLKDRVIGVLNVTDKPQGDIFNSFELRVLSTVANQVASTFENIVLEKDVQEKAKLDRELALAGEIQTHSLSTIPGDLPDISIGAFSIPAQSMGGDFYEITPFDDNHIAGSVGDVSGKGIYAAIFMNSIRNALRFEALTCKNPKKLVSRINKWAYRESRNGMFCTFFYTLIDRKNKIFHYTSAGHNSQLFYRAKDQSFHLLKTRGRPLGLSEEYDYGLESMSYAKGDILVLFTDGLIEDVSGENITLDDFKRYIKENNTISAVEMVDTIKEMNQCQVKEINDDSTLMIIKFQ